MQRVKPIGMQEQGIRHAENGRVRADAESEGEDDNRREPRGLA